MTAPGPARTTGFVAAASIAFVLIAGAFVSFPARAGPSCSGSDLIDETLQNGARWQLCWDERTREGIAYHEVFYSPPGGSERQIFYQLSLAQIHVPYDDNGARYHDVTDYGAGGGNLNDLTPADCPGGTLLVDGGKDVVCKRILPSDSGFDANGIQRRGTLLDLFSVSHIGAYNYIPTIRFHDNGVIEILMGATGELQRFEYGDPGAASYGWPLDAGGDRIGISHIHNYYFRLDFDLAGSAEDDIVEQIEILADATATTRQKVITPFLTEAAADVAPANLRTWRIRDGGTTNTYGHAVSYELVPLDTGHRDEGPSYEPFTHDDFYVTRHSDCELYASHNNQVLGCGDDLSEFVSGESLVGQDLVVWYGMTFHHIPRDEDESRMHAHWNGFRLEPRDWLDDTPIGTAPPPPPTPLTCPSDAIDFEALALESYSNQDLGGTATPQDDGLGLAMEGNTWKRSLTSFDIASDTLLEFEFSSDQEGEIHAIGLDEDSTIDNDPRLFRFWGDQSWSSPGKIELTPPYDGSGDEQHFSIPVGQYFTGSNMRLVLVNDQDQGGQTAESHYRCVRIGLALNPPVWIDPGDQVNNEGDVVDLALSADDPDEDPITYSAVGLPPGLTIDSATGAITGTLNYACAGNYAVTATANDGNQSVDQLFEWSIANVNRAPIWHDPGPQLHRVGDPVNLLVSATDPDGDPVDYAADGLPVGLNLDESTGEISGIPAPVSEGEHTVTIWANDAEASDAIEIAWSIQGLIQLVPVLAWWGALGLIGSCSLIAARALKRR